MKHYKTAESLTCLLYTSTDVARALEKKDVTQEALMQAVKARVHG